MQSILPSPGCSHALCSKGRKDWGRIQFCMMKQSWSGCGLADPYSNSGSVSSEEDLIS